MKSEQFTFKHGSLTLRGYLDSPDNGFSKGIVVIVQGDGESNIDSGVYGHLRRSVAAAGFSCCVWDKPGCGQSDGRYKQEPVSYSAKEVVCAIIELNRIGAPGSSHIGMWGESRAGWICPLVIQEYSAIAFWIIVGGTDDKESMSYMVQSHLELSRTPSLEAQSLASDWAHGTRIFMTGGSVFEYLRATKKLRQNAFYRQHIGPSSIFQILLGYTFLQRQYMKSPHVFDESTGLEVYVTEFDSILQSISCPVLAIFGELDRMVDWRKTSELYRSTLGPGLTLKLFPNGDHNILETKTGSYFEKKSKHVDGYFELITDWLSNLTLDGMPDQAANLHLTSRST